MAPALWFASTLIVIGMVTLIPAEGAPGVPVAVVVAVLLRPWRRSL